MQDSKKQDSSPMAVQRCHELLLWLIPLLDQFPRNRRFTLGERIESGLLDILQLLVEAAYSRQKKNTLRQANLSLSTVRHLWRLTFELKVINSKRYEYGARLMLDLGAQIGGWQKSVSG
jgi:hypothetical protein